VVVLYRVCVIDQILPHSPADYVRRPTVLVDSPTLGLGHLQFEALITTPRLSANRNDFALALLGLRIFEACGASVADLGEEHGHRGPPRARQGAARWSSCRYHRPSAAIDHAIDGRIDGHPAALALHHPGQRTEVLEAFEESAG